ncbi:hypothetical protein L5515_007310 [Caenorhabditis briggsae]|uniref:Uncharacterized protein n=1 Tax=Caenorhabditis briggsae TaxID=6238 RepID=A0AAE9JJX7_CAEBR|nr:hypothetical protein L5515_007310 [Caenorhabditis briggsae]
MKAYKTLTSKNTRKRQMGFLYALTLTATIPNVLLFAPTMVFILCSIHSHSYNAVPGDIIVCIVGLHGLLSTVTLILSYKPFRMELVHCMRRCLFWKSQTKQKIIRCEQVTKSVRY